MLGLNIPPPATFSSYQRIIDYTTPLPSSWFFFAMTSGGGYREFGMAAAGENALP
jgi:hypothetical protein